MEIKQTETILTFYPDKNSEAIICCPSCGFARTIDASQYQNTGKALNVKCRCGQTFKCSIDFRKFYRKRASLVGMYIILKNDKKGDMLVEDISMGGIGFNNMSPHNLEKGDVLEIKFKLDNAKQTEMIRKVKVMIIKGRFIGTEFTEKNRFDSDLGFYLAP